MISKLDFQYKQILIYYPYAGDKISYKNDNIVIRDKDNKIKYQSTCYRLFALFVVGDTTITTGLIRRSKKFGFSICLFSAGMKLYEVIGSKMEGNTLLRKKQYDYNDLIIGQKIVANKIQNQIAALNQIRNKSIITKKSIYYLKENLKSIESNELELLTILGIEGNASKIYFREIFDDVDWIGRKPRIKCDYINSTLDIGYTILFNVIDAITNIYGFDTYYGVLHRCFYMRKSLICDLMEPLRPLIDYCVRKGINLDKIKEDDFERIGNRVVLKWKESSKYTSMFMGEILKHKEEIFLYIQGYYRKFMKGVLENDFPTIRIW
ncbi:MAG: type V CRISPR-associated endonuclease Cas1 [Eubacteriales bacterium]|nr:type V CRISPR-associated endonuclease Cas1 [Eubacteriales bacterium]MDY3332744.1 type V CRISPR-associated endonuclease Cas1 [Gallibacter sp.]